MLASLIRLKRALAQNSTFPALEPGELAVNTYNGQLVVGDHDIERRGQAVPLTGVLQFLPTALYYIGQLVTHDGQVFRCRNQSITGAFDPLQWEQITGQTFNKGVFNPTQVITAPYVTKANEWCRVNTLVSGVTVELPASPEDGISVRISDVGNNFINNPCTVLHGAEFINGKAEDLVLQETKDIILLFTANLGWSAF